jgi:hypothetical protein
LRAEGWTTRPPERTTQILRPMERGGIGLSGGKVKGRRQTEIRPAGIATPALSRCHRHLRFKQQVGGISKRIRRQYSLTVLGTCLTTQGMPFSHQGVTGSGVPGRIGGSC